MMLEIDPFYWHLARWLIAGVFAAALTHKLSSVDTFKNVVQEYDLVPEGMAPLASHLFVLLEGLVVIGLASGLLLPGAAGLAVALLALYGAGMAINLARGRRNIDCGCFGAAGNAGGRHALSEWLLLRNLLLIALTVLLFVPVAGRQLTWLDVSAIAAASAAGFAIYAAADQIMANAARLEGVLR